MYKRQQRKNNLIIAAWLSGSFLVICAGIIASILVAESSWIHWSRYGYWLLVPVGVPGLTFGSYSLTRNGMLHRSMRDYRVGEEELRYFEREYLRGPTKRYGKVVLTDHWFFDQSISATCLLPLKEAAWIYSIATKGHNRNTGTYWVCSVEVRFRNGTKLHVRCDKNQIDRAMGEFAKRCPQAHLGHSPAWEQAWKEGVKQWHSSQ